MTGRIRFHDVCVLDGLAVSDVALLNAQLRGRIVNVSVRSLCEVMFYYMG
jgi:hypothetical protein